MYVRQVDEQVLTLQVSGKLWMRSLVMRDVETGSEWAHQLGQAMAGPLQGKELRPIISDMVTWAAWLERHPTTSVLNMSRTSQEFSREFYRDPSRFVLGFKASGEHYALPMQEMVQHPVHFFRIGAHAFVAAFDPEGAAIYLFDAQVEAQALEFRASTPGRMQDAQSGSTWSISGGEALEGEMRGRALKPIIGIMSFRNAWQSFHPQSQDIPFP